ncbi:response regulator [Pseudochryseolinea flava]|uniref:Response regulatory domain-containing protein n=1 Tax=Pseudochryseolinea flava TaxID=2059302 RepID=A0A364XWY9_9BACT|nr:response regulator [Pseudochryseolinea flava]RAV98713.1 hypothetical protein DQQ10_22110 [Pseudochryseolinea flava]
MKKIYLAEDDIDDQEIFREIIDALDHGIQLTIFHNGEELIKALNVLPNDELPDLLLLDQNMPRLKGSETIQQIRSEPRYKPLPVAIYTTYHDANFARLCKEEGIELFQKPDTFDELSKLIHRLVAMYIK